MSNEAAQHIQHIQDVNIAEMKTAFLRLEPQFEGQKLNYVKLESNKTLKDFLRIEPEDYTKTAYLYGDKVLKLTIAGHELTSPNVDILYYFDFERALDKEDTVDLNNREHSTLQLKDQSRAQTNKLDIAGTVFGGFNNSQEEDFYNLLIENGLKKTTANILVVRENISTIEELKERMPTLRNIRSVSDKKIGEITTVYNRIEKSFKDSLIDKGFPTQLIETLVDQNRIVSLGGLRERLPTLQETNEIDVQQANNLKTVINQIEKKPVLSSNRAAFPRTQSAAQLLIKTYLNEDTSPSIESSLSSPTQSNSSSASGDSRRILGAQHLPIQSSQAQSIKPSEDP